MARRSPRRLSLARTCRSASWREQKTENESREPGASRASEARRSIDRSLENLESNSQLSRSVSMATTPPLSAPVIRVDTSVGSFDVE